jgi:hypothetical protein
MTMTTIVRRRGKTIAVMSARILNCCNPDQSLSVDPRNTLERNRKVQRKARLHVPWRLYGGSSKHRTYFHNPQNGTRAYVAITQQVSHDVAMYGIWQHGEARQGKGRKPQVESSNASRTHFCGHPCTFDGGGLKIRLLSR